MYTYAARYPGAGFEVYGVGIVTSVSKTKPRLIKHQIRSVTALKTAIKGKREAYFNGKMTQTSVYDLSKLEAGNVIEGPAIIEAPTTTLVVPDDMEVEVDEYLTLRLIRLKRDQGGLGNG
jgi:N-methylhydantoinase A/oxoprolinase/acetone carboxylase beta subunit